METRTFPVSMYFERIAGSASEWKVEHGAQFGDTYATTVTGASSLPIHWSASRGGTSGMVWAKTPVARRIGATACAIASSPCFAGRFPNSI